MIELCQGVYGIFQLAQYSRELALMTPFPRDIANGKQDIQTACADSFASFGSNITHGTYILKKRKKCAYVCVGWGLGLKNGMRPKENNSSTSNSFHFPPSGRILGFY